MGAVINTAATDGLVLKHHAISIHSAISFFFVLHHISMVSCQKDPSAMRKHGR